MTFDPLLTCPQVAKMLGIRPATVRAWTSEGRIPFVRLGRKLVRYRQADVERLIEAGKRPVRAGEPDELERWLATGHEGTAMA